MKKNVQQAFLLATNRFSDSVMQSFGAIKKAASPDADVVLLFHSDGGELPEACRSLPHFPFTLGIFNELPYIPLGGHSLVPGNNHFPLLKFYLLHRHYQYYWYIEDDVRFNGDWQYFFNAFRGTNDDLITCNLKYAPQQPEWPWWSSLSNPHRVIPPEARIRSFNPIYRISGAALFAVHQALSGGWCGHHEVLLPTILFHAGFNLLDFGGVGSFVRPGSENKYYTGNGQSPSGEKTYGTVRWRPVFTQTGTEKNKLYHPVKA